jgi:hypothetical protein
MMEAKEIQKKPTHHLTSTSLHALGELHRLPSKRKRNMKIFPHISDFWLPPIMQAYPTRFKRSTVVPVL